MMTMLCLVAVLFVILVREWRSLRDKAPKLGWVSDSTNDNMSLPKTNTTTPAYTQPLGTAGPSVPGGE